MVHLNRFGGHVFLVVHMGVWRCSTSFRQLLLDNCLELAAINSAMGTVVMEVAPVLTSSLVHWDLVILLGFGSRKFLCLGFVPRGAVILGSTVLILEAGHHRRGGTIVLLLLS